MELTAEEVLFGARDSARFERVSEFGFTFCFWAIPGDIVGRTGGECFIAQVCGLESFADVDPGFEAFLAVGLQFGRTVRMQEYGHPFRVDRFGFEKVVKSKGINPGCIAEHKIRLRLLL